MRCLKAFFTCAAAALVTSTTASADVLFDFNQIGNDVVLTVSGSFNYSSLVPQETGTSSFASVITANDAIVGIDTTGGSIPWINWRIDEQGAYTSPFYGDGSPAGSITRLATTTSGDATARLLGNPNSFPESTEVRLRLPATYAANAPMSGTATWANKIYADLGMASSGTWTYRSADGDYVTMQINAVPEPTAGLVGAGLTTAAGIIAWRRRSTATRP